MSAIAGILHFNNEPVNPEAGMKLMQSLSRYPADAVQTWHNQQIFLGCHSQWITPESIREQLPFYDYEKQLVIASDAIIDNRKELFERLQVHHAQQKEMSDSQIILLAYEKWGEECPKYLVGDFAFMIWDEKKRKLFGARDFSGCRTLYYTNKNNHFAFCTVINPLLTLRFVTKDLNEQWLADYLAIPWNFESVDVRSTVYNNIQQLPPSHTISIINGNSTLTRYLTLEFDKKLKLKSNKEYEEAFREVFKTAVDDRLRTHLKVGAHLSGGLDSGSVASFAARSLRKENKSLYSYSYVPVKDFVDWTPKRRVANERPFIESTVKYVGNIQDHYFDFEGKSPYTEIDDWLDTMEMPYKFFENSFWLKGIYEYAHLQGIGVLLNGQRGNWTISWGPALAYQTLLLKRLKLFRFIRELRLYSEKVGVQGSKVFKHVRKKAFPFTNLHKEDTDLYPLIINPEFARKMNVFDRLKENEIDARGMSNQNVYEVKKIQFDKLYYWNVNGTYTTKLSLKHKLWDRDPTNDLRIVKFCISIPEEQYVQNGQDRSLIRRATENYLPDTIRLNQRTRGVQGTDGIHRMVSYWRDFIKEVRLMCEDQWIGNFLNVENIRVALKKIEGSPTSKNVFEHEFRIIMRSLIFYRFIKKTFHGRG
ncbi:asparagine synthase-related protein [Fictibacillus fluitans]|uniref:asparagine synthase (glutamine-hydrolyzing) n=1 Tax=Fictibacillus fluitans TaxID=3058422 RepID=A0ABT8I179_9BACL|nr:asparagine synthase-related protein [Fictibacillus sp. NE201]MDN4526746.1 asparagine synthase-related protein [Fictibacillus sp. NE201]